MRHRARQRSAARDPLRRAVTPLGPLFTAWCAVNRRTASGRTLGALSRSASPMPCAPSHSAAAYTLKLDGEIAPSRWASAPTSACLRPIRRRRARKPEGCARVGHRAGRPHLPRGQRMSEARGPESAAPILVTVVGGYLGAGKTTLVNALLRQAQAFACRAGERFRRVADRCRPDRGAGRQTSSRSRADAYAAATAAISSQR